MSNPSLSDRCFQYGDGLFETMRVEGGEIPQFELHWARLKRGAEVLGFRLPAKRILERRCRSLAAATANLDSGSPVPLAALKLQLSRGDSQGGYAANSTQPANVYISIRPVKLNPQFQHQGISLRYCQQRLSIQPVLAGLKHCNRLEQVLARREWQQDYQEGLMLDTEGYVVEGTSSNLFLYADGAWKTPLLDRCGVAGIMRQRFMDYCEQQGQPVQQCRVTVADVDAAKHLLMSNALVGLWPVAELEGRAKTLHPQSAELTAYFAAPNEV